MLKTSFLQNISPIPDKLLIKIDINWFPQDIKNVYIIFSKSACIHNLYLNKSKKHPFIYNYVKNIKHQGIHLAKYMQDYCCIN